MRLIDLQGERFCRLVVTSRAPNRAGGKHVAWNCQCDCGRAIAVTAVHLRSGHTQSCGCLIVDRTRARSTTHGHSTGRSISPELRSWMGAKHRCQNPNSRNYADYGGRGISMCERWADDFAAFIDDMGPRPDGTSLDRIDVNGNYEPGNCRWATLQQQANNKRTSIMVVHEGETMTLKQLSRRTGQAYFRLYKAHVRQHSRPPAEPPR